MIGTGARQALHGPCSVDCNYLPRMTALNKCRPCLFRSWTFLRINLGHPEGAFRHNAATYLLSTQLGNNVTKDELRAELERQEQRYKDVYGGEVTTYAAQPEPERKPWRKRASLLDQAFAQEIQKIEQELKTEEP